jgi:DNA invertase Pin-like site-specific DNA recombinase
MASVPQFHAGPRPHIGVRETRANRKANARVSTADQNPDHQTDALTRAGVDPAKIYLDHASGAKASRPELDKALGSANRAGDQLVITRLDRLGRSVLRLVTLGAALRERGVGLHVLEQVIGTMTAEGRAMFGMLSVLAELQRELIIANTRDGLAAARARGRTGGRRPKLTPDQAHHAQQLYDAGDTPFNESPTCFRFRAPRSTATSKNQASDDGPRPATPARRNSSFGPNPCYLGPTGLA